MERQRGWWRRASVLVSLAASLVAAGLTWWVVTEGGAAPRPVVGAGDSSTIASQPGEGTAAPGATAPAAPKASARTTGPAQPAGPAAVQARAMNDVLASSNASHSGLTDAIVATSQCRRNGLARIVDITAGRRDQLAAARALKVDDLPDGTALRKSLVAALDASFDADAAFLSWARRHLAGDCSGPVAEDRDYRRGLARSEDARKAKARFADAWRTVAKAYDLPAWRPDQI
ncbi:hypothetical protein ACWEPN_13605 [Nonomuraea wenchangensis]